MPSKLKKYNYADESPDFSTPVEWWFVQGWYTKTGRIKNHFMLSLFRQKVSDDPKDTSSGFSLIVSVMDGKTGRRKWLSQIDEAVVALYLKAGENIKTSNLHSYLVEAYRGEIKEYGIPSPVVLNTKKTRISGHPLRIDWEDFSLRQDEDVFTLYFRAPLTSEKCKFKLSVAAPRLYSNPPGKEFMSYAAYTRLRIKGASGSKNVKGEAWLDHQNGNYGWFVTSAEGGKVIGWDWIGINFDSGPDWLAITHRDMKSRDVIKRELYIDNAEVCHDKFDMAPVEFWESEDTHITYPVAWRLTSRELDADLEIKALYPNQEIQFFGVIRAVWEGAVNVTGTVRGKKVSGRGWVELHGYGYVFDLESYLDVFIKRIDKRIEEFMPEVLDKKKLEYYMGPEEWGRDPVAYTEGISKPVWDLLKRKGKHWRPIFALLMLEMLGARSRPYELLISVVLELSHSAALIIDDIEDESLIRRGDVCVHRRYGVDVAINAANALYFLPYLLLPDYPDLSPGQRLSMYNIMINVWVKAHFGQAQDIYWSRNISEDNLKKWMDGSLGANILEMYMHKTGSSVLGVAEIVCVIASPTEKTRQAFISLARIFGVVFQIIDDVHNFSDSPKWTKTCGEDLYAGKVTYVIIKAIEKLDAPGKDRLMRILSDRGLREDKVVLEEGISLVKRSGALDACREEAKDMIEKEWKNFSKAVPPSTTKTMLRMLCASLLNITYESS